MSFFTVDGITAGYGREPVIRDISFELESGCLMGILGANGCGKTTLLKALCGILPHTGYCSLMGETLEHLSPRRLAQLCGYIPQRSGISIDISALDVVLMGFNPRLGILQQPTTAMKAQALAALDRVGLPGRAQDNYLHLSEGQKQLCMLARTLVTDSKLLLLDEPESALDFRYRDRMLEMLAQWVADGNRSTVLSLHDPMLALNHCHKLLFMDKGQVLGIVRPHTDALAETERLLCRIYGPVSLQTCRTRSGLSRLVMLKEELA